MSWRAPANLGGTRPVCVCGAWEGSGFGSGDREWGHGRLCFPVPGTPGLVVSGSTKPSLTAVGVESAQHFWKPGPGLWLNVHACTGLCGKLRAASAWLKRAKASNVRKKSALSRGSTLQHGTNSAGVPAARTTAAGLRQGPREALLLHTSTWRGFICASVRPVGPAQDLDTWAISLLASKTNSGSRKSEKLFQMLRDI